MTKPIKAKLVAEVSLTDPDSGSQVEVSIYKMETGGMIGIDSSFLSNTDEPVWSPFDQGVMLDLGESEKPKDPAAALTAKGTIRAEDMKCGCGKKGWAFNPRATEAIDPLCVTCFETVHPGLAKLQCHTVGCTNECVNSGPLNAETQLEQDYMCDGCHAEHRRTVANLRPWRTKLTPEQILEMLESLPYVPQ